MSGLRQVGEDLMTINLFCCFVNSLKNNKNIHDCSKCT